MEEEGSFEPEDPSQPRWTRDLVGDHPEGTRQNGDRIPVPICQAWSKGGGTTWGSGSRAGRPYNRSMKGSGSTWPPDAPWGSGKRPDPQPTRGPTRGTSRLTWNWLLPWRISSALLHQPRACCGFSNPPRLAQDSRSRPTRLTLQKRACEGVARPFLSASWPRWGSNRVWIGSVSTDAMQ